MVPSPTLNILTQYWILANLKNKCPVPERRAHITRHKLVLYDECGDATKKQWAIEQSTETYSASGIRQSLSF